MTKDELKSLPELVEQKKISMKHAVNKLAEFIYENQTGFGLSKYDEDFRSEFFLLLLQRADRLFKKYDKNMNFLRYMHMFVRGLITFNSRNMKDRFYNDIIYKTANRCEVEYDSGKTASELFVSSSAGIYYAGRNSSGHATQNYCLRKSKKSKKTALVLALKSSYYISDRDIDIVSNYCGIKKQNLENMVDEINMDLDKKAERHEEYLKMRDNAYYFHRKYDFILNKSRKERRETDKNIERKYKTQTEKWKAKTQALQDSCHRVSPSNKTVARILGICERQVCNYIKYATNLKLKSQDKEKTAGDD